MTGEHDAAAALQRALQVQVSDATLWDQALTHRSWAFEAGGVPDNERLEFLGDAVLQVIITDEIYRRFTDAREGRLAKLRAAMVNTGRLADVARSLDLGAAVKLGRGEEQSGGRDKDSILADTLEAVIGAVYLDRGPATVRSLVLRLFRPLVDELSTQHAALDYKTSLQELAAAELSSLPVYEVSDTGPDHDKVFTAQVMLDGEWLGRGAGRSKKAAEQEAAREAYSALAKRFAHSDGQVDGPDTVSRNRTDPSGEHR
ncbi:MAG TPA: ribonuclease III [Euzebyales bacterium]|nr:ribonuclease III [Euzebyales bacterium]